MGARVQDVVELGYTPLVRVFLVREPHFVLHVLTNPLSELDWQIVEHRVVLAIRIPQPYTVRRTESSSHWQAASTIKMSSCVFCAFMLAEHTCSTILDCCSSWRAWKLEQPSAKAQSEQESGARTNSY